MTLPRIQWKEKIDKRRLIGPAIYTCGPIIYGPAPNIKETVMDQKAAGFDFIKLYSFVSKKEFHEALTTAKQTGIYTAGHVPFQVGLDRVLLEGINEIAHIEELAWEFVNFDRNTNIAGGAWIRYVIELAYKQYKTFYADISLEELEEKYRDLALSIAKKVRSSDVPVSTTLYLDDVIVEKLHSPKEFLSRSENTYLPKSYRAAFRQGREKHQMLFRGGEDFAPFKRTVDRLLLKYLKNENVLLVLGTDAGTGAMGLVPGHSVHNELHLLTESGFTPYEAIKAATVNAAIVVERMKGSADFGTIEVGKRADLILVKGNPLQDIANAQNILGVMASGRWYDKARLDKLIK